MDAGRVGPLWAKLKKRLHDPLQLRFALGGAMLIVWYAGVYRPMSAWIDEAVAARARSEAHLAPARAIEALRSQAAKFRDRLPEKADRNEWIEYMLAGIRKYPLKLQKLDPQALEKHGPFNLMVLKIELQGTFAELNGFLGWIESNPRLFRVDQVDLHSIQGDAGGLDLQMTVLGVMG
ncbi:type 4a pilus biogenesis protein PilO [Paludisphaera mucosa]|uniref:Type 4a pilus biogenesis protein PilO n=1 Tax=Paludisphaera mucosa TaxID=3030827 RepID=A0ABT6FJE3_9BACT|nr:type 4a pilus biogenesis protein PilO [Paludisphaera mucosa]MDG3007710.1 type 4a pilus biogenesis protein PilO [Paludisphaera mucosa]